MPLTLRRTGLGSGVDRPVYMVCCGGWEVGRLYQMRGGPDCLRWFWSLTVSGPMTRSDKVATLDEAKAHFNGTLGRRGQTWKGVARPHLQAAPKDA
jgi:hypothetical protein